MALEFIAADQMDDGTDITVGTDRHGTHLLVFDGPGRLETVIQFNDVQIDANSITFVREHFTGHRTIRVETGSIEADPVIVELLGDLEAAV